MGSQRILLVRHGETTWNVDGRWQGDIDVPLNDVGRAQAQALGDYLTDVGVEAIIASDLTRTRETAEIIGAALGLPVSLDPRWREMRLGIFQGLTLPEIKTKYTAEHRVFMQDYWNYAIQGGESRRQVQNRALAALLDVRASGATTLVVTHGGPVRLLLLKLFDGHPEIANLHVGNTSVTTLEVQGDEWGLIEVTAMHHLMRAGRDTIDAM